MQVVAELIGALVLIGLLGLGVDWLMRNVQIVRRDQSANTLNDKQGKPDGQQ